MSGYARMIAEDERGGRVVLSIQSVHTYECPYWRMGKKHAPCNCGAFDAWMEGGVQREVERAEDRFGAMP